MNFDTKQKPNWCPGCGNFGITSALKQALNELKLKQENIVMTSGIGCSSKHPHWVRVNAFNGLHGRPVALAEGVLLANHKLKVIATGGDGDGYAEGTNHFVHLCRSNMNITYIVHDNKIYALTKGQASPTSDEGIVTKTSPFGVIEKPLNPILLALSAGATFVARAYAGNIKHLKEILKKAISHKGTALVDVLQPCVTFNKINTYKWYSDRVYELKKPLKTRKQAILKSMEWGDKIPIGIFYQAKEPTYEDRIPPIKKTPLVKTQYKTNINSLMKELM